MYNYINMLKQGLADLTTTSVLEKSDVVVKSAKSCFKYPTIIIIEPMGDGKGLEPLELHFNISQKTWYEQELLNFKIHKSTVVWYWIYRTTHATSMDNVMM